MKYRKENNMKALTVTETNYILFQESKRMSHIENKDFEFYTKSYRHDELVYGKVNENFLDIKIEDLDKMEKESDRKLELNEYIESSNLHVFDYEGTFNPDDPRPVEYTDHLKRLFDYCYPYLRAEMDKIKYNNGFDKWKYSGQYPGAKYQINILWNMYHQVLNADSWYRIISIHESYKGENLSYRFDIVHTIDPGYCDRYAIIVDGYEVFAIEAIQVSDDNKLYTVLYKTDYRKTNLRAFVSVIVSDNIETNEVAADRFMRNGIHYDGGIEAVIKAYHRLY